MKLALVISSLAMGGAESVLAWLANGLCGRGHDLVVLTLDDGREESFYPLNPIIRHIPLGLAGNSTGAISAMAGNLKRVLTLRTAIGAESPDAVVSFIEQTNILTLLAVGGRWPVIVSERVHPMHPVGTPWRWLRRLTYGRASALVVQTRSIAHEFDWLDANRVMVIPNAAIPPDQDMPTFRFSSPAVVGMGRLHHQKGFDLLLRAFAGVAQECPEWQVVIFGKGPEEAELQSLATRLGLACRVHFAGMTPTPHADLAQGDIFAFPSRFEGFPNALCEAMSIGMACVAADCPGGPADLISDGRNGLLVPPDDVEALSGALRLLMADESLRTRLGGQASDVVERFSVERVMDQWENCLRQVVAANSEGG